MSECNNEIRELIPLYYDNELTKEETKRVIEHVSICEDCREELKFYELCRDEFLLDDIEVPDGFHNNMMDKLRESNQPTTEITKKRNKPIGLYRKFNKYINVAAALTFVVLLSVIGISNMNKDSDDYKSDSRAVSKSEISDNGTTKFDELADSDMLESTIEMESPSTEIAHETSDMAMDDSAETEELGAELDGMVPIEPTEQNYKNSEDIDSEDKEVVMSEVEVTEMPEEASTEVVTGTGGALDEEETNYTATVDSDRAGDIFEEETNDLAAGTQQTPRLSASDADIEISYSAVGELEDDDLDKEDRSDESDDNNNYSYLGLLVLLSLSAISGVVIFIFIRKNN